MGEEEKKVEEKVEEKVEQKVEEVTEVAEDPVEALAKEIGWNPNHDGSDGRESLNARDFILKSKEIQNTNAKQMKSMRRKIEDHERTFDELKKHNEMVYKAQLTQLKKEISDLRSERKSAYEAEDHDRVREIDTQIKNIESVPSELPASSKKELHPDFVKWRDQNDWYENDDELKQYADFLGTAPEYQALAQVNLDRCLKKITKAVKAEFPERFGQPKLEPKPSAATVEGATRKTTPKTKYTVKDLNDDQRKIAKDFEHMGIMTVEEYIEDLVKANKIGE